MECIRGHYKDSEGYDIVKIVNYGDCLKCMRKYLAISECYVMIRKEWVKERFVEWNIEYYEDWYKDKKLKARMDKIPYAFNIPNDISFECYQSIVAEIKR